MNVFLIIATLGPVVGTTSVDVTPVASMDQCALLVRHADALDRLVHKNQRNAQFSAVCIETTKDGQPVYQMIFHDGKWTK